MVISGALILPVFILWRRRAAEPFPWRDAPLLFLVGAGGCAFNQFLFVLGLGRTSVPHAAIIVSLGPLQVLLLAALLGQERITMRKALGMAVAVGGIAVLQFARTGTGEHSPLGDAICFFSGTAFACYTVFGKRLSARHGPVTMNTFCYVGGAVAFAPFLFLHSNNFAFANVSAGAWLGAAYMAIFSSLISYLIYYYALQYISASRVSSFSYLQPLLATLFAIPILGEHVTSALVAGGALVLAGVYVTERA
jgi:drug/metabolite transporter (DMT)-like permease